MGKKRKAKKATRTVYETLTFVFYVLFTWAAAAVFVAWFTYLGYYFLGVWGGVVAFLVALFTAVKVFVELMR